MTSVRRMFTLILLLVFLVYQITASNHTDSAAVPEAQCGRPPTSLNTTTQENFDDVTWPWLVSLETLDGSALLCSGTILNSRWVITSADCAQNIATTADDDQTEDTDDDEDQSAATASFDLQAVAGAPCLSCQDQPTQQSRRIVEVHLHPGFDADFLVNNLALLRVAEDFEFDEGGLVAPVCLAGTSDVQEEDIGATNTSCLTVGWPATQINENDDDLLLLEANVTIAPQSVCNNGLASSLGNSTLRTDEICSLIELTDLRGSGNSSNEVNGTEAAEKEPCHWGGSGDPLLCRQFSGSNNDSSIVWELQGIASWGGDCSEGTTEPLRQLAVYSRIREFASWIKDTAIVS